MHSSGATVHARVRAKLRLVLAPKNEGFYPVRFLSVDSSRLIAFPGFGIASKIGATMGILITDLPRQSFANFVRSLTVTALLAFASTQVRGAVTLTVGSNVNISKSAQNNAEECIAINPRNPLNLFASDTWALMTRYSQDGGMTWNDSNLSSLPASIGDVSAAFDSFGNLYLVRLTPSPYRASCGLSTSGGASFSPLFQTSGSETNVDQPSVVTGPSAVTGQASVWINYTTSSGNQVARGASVTGLGAIGAFSAAEVAATAGDYGDIVVGPAGKVFTVYQDPNGGIGPDTIFGNLDADGTGAGGFGPQITTTSTQVGSYASLPAQPRRDVDSEAGLAWDCSGGPFNGRLYLVYTDRPSTSSADTDIYVRFSNNNGTNWSSRVRVNDDAIGNGKSQFLPRIAIDQTSGNIAVSFYDCRNSPGNNTTELWATISTDGGATFLPNVKVSAGVSSALVTAIANTGFDYGDYCGLCFHGGTFYPCWADNSNSTGDNPAGASNNFDIYTARVTVNVPLVMLNPRYINSTFRASVQTVAAKTYYLESTAILNPASWSAVTSVPGDGTVKDLVDSNATGPAEYYRVRAQ